MSELRQRGAKATKEQKQGEGVSSAPASGKSVSVSSASSVPVPVIGEKSFLFGYSAFAVACFLLLLPIRCFSALYTPIQDCDETFNYWEPLHYLMFGRGLQTWEYSPTYGLRSYFYLWIISPAGWIAKWAQELGSELVLIAPSLGLTVPAPLMALVRPGGEVDKILIFYAIRLSFAVACTLVECSLLATIRQVLGRGVAKWTLAFLALSAGMFHASSAFLPQTFTMFFVMLTLRAWLLREYGWGIFFTGICCLVGWPFSALLSIPLALEVLFVFRGLNIVQPIFWGLTTVFLTVVPTVLVDYFYYRRFLFAIFNIAVYNSNASSDHGANLYGREPASYYFSNLFLNFNVGFPLALLAPVLLVLVWLVRKCRKSSSPTPLVMHEFSVLKFLLPFFLWFGIFIAMPHKEERFLFVVYPYLALTAGVATFILSQLFKGTIIPFSIANLNLKRGILSTLFAVGILTAFTTLSTSRSASLIINYQAPFPIWHSLAAHVNPSEAAKAVVRKSLVFNKDDQALDHAKTQLKHLQTAPVHTLYACVGKEWYRFPSTFFLPTIPGQPKGKDSYPRQEVQLRFLESEFGGLLPKPYLEEWQHVSKQAQVLFDEYEAGIKSGKIVPNRASSPSAVQKQLKNILPVEMQKGLDTNILFQSMYSPLRFPEHTLLDSMLPHSFSRPGTFQTPTGMNDLNRKELEGRFLPLEQCHFVVDLELGDEQKEETLENKVVQLKQEKYENGKCVKAYRFDVVESRPFLHADASGSNSLFRAFYVPFGYSEKNNVFKPYQLLKREPIYCDP